MTTRRTLRAGRQPVRLSGWREQLVSRRRFLVGAAGGTVAALFPLRIVGSSAATPRLDAGSRWKLIGEVQDHLFPSEPAAAPGAREINALAYLEWVVADDNLDPDHRAFVLRGAEWVEEHALALEQASFGELNEAGRERVLRQVAATDGGENWLSTVLMYLFEALLTDPVYGGNPDGIGWKWLGHTPGFPRPSAGTRYGKA